MFNSKSDDKLQDIKFYDVYKYNELGNYNKTIYQTLAKITNQQEQ